MGGSILYGNSQLIVTKKKLFLVTKFFQTNFQCHKKSLERPLRFLYQVKCAQSHRCPHPANIYLFKVNNRSAGKGLCCCLWTSKCELGEKILIYYKKPPHHFWSITSLMMEVPTYRNQSIDMQCKSMGWFLYDTDLPHERVKTERWMG